MSEVKSKSHPSGGDKPVTAPTAKGVAGCNVQREDLRLDCLRLAAQRQGARDSRGLLEIAGEYYGWVTAESSVELCPVSLPQAAPDVIDWPSAKSAPASRSSTRLSLGRKSSPANARTKRSARRPHPDPSD